MAEWNSKLDLTDIWDNYVGTGKMSVQELALEISKRLAKLDINTSHIGIISKRDEICIDFEYFSEDDNASVNEFDYIMEDLYDWGDWRLDNKLFGGKKVCWIATKF